jgi:hypothetical protein
VDCDTGVVFSPTPDSDELSLSGGARAPSTAKALARGGRARYLVLDCSMGNERRSPPDGRTAERASAAPGVRRRKRRRKASEHASLIPKSTLSEIFDAADADDEEDLEFIEVEPEEEPAVAKPAPWWSVHPVPAPPRRASTSPPPLLRRPAAADAEPELPVIAPVEPPALAPPELATSLLPPPVFTPLTTDAPLVSASEPARASGDERSRIPVRAAAVLVVLGASVVFGLGIGRAPTSHSAAASPPTVAPRQVETAEPSRPMAEARAAAERPVPLASSEVLALEAEPPADPNSVAPTEAAAFSNPSEAVVPTGVVAPKATATSAPLAAFDSALAAMAINEAARRAASCRGPSDPEGQAMVMLKYAPSGRVTTATIESGPFAGTTVGGCIARAFRSARVPAFSGEPMTVRKTITYP